MPKPAKWDAAMAAETTDEPAAIAFVGRPNVGKSSLLNALLGEDRAIVSEIPGTTRDAIDTRLAWGRSEVVLIDTAGIRRRGKVAGGPAAEKYSTLRALHALSRADVAVLVVDAVEGLTSQDAHVAGYVIEEGKGLVIAVNKWDLVEDKTDKTFDQYVEWIRNEVPFLDFAPIVSISAKTGQRVGRVLEAAIDIWGERRKRISTGELNRVLIAATERTPPPPVRGHRPKLFYATQAVGRAADVHLLRLGRVGGPLQLPALPREPAARAVRVRRDADPARLPRPRRRSSCRAARSCGAPRSRPARGRAAGPPGGHASRADGHGLMAGPRVAVVGAGAWGTTLARVVARMEPVTLLATPRRRRHGSPRPGATRRACPGIDLPADRASRPPIRARCATPPTWSSSRRRRRTCGRPSRRVAPVPGARRRPAVGGQGPRARDAAADERGHRRGRGRADRPGRGAVGPEPGRRGRAQPAGVGGRRGRGPRARRARRRAARPPRFRLYVNEDILGVELCGALKNVVAIAAGAADGLGFGDNGKAGLLTRGLAEMTRLGIAAGANPLTFAGLAGMGDLIATARLAPVAQPPARRGAREGPHVGRDRGDAAGHGRGRLHGPGRARPGRALRRRDADRPRGRSARCSRARASSAAWSTCSPANRRTSWPTTAAGSSAWRPTARSEPSGRGVDRGPGARLRVRRGVAQSGSAPVWGTGGRRFKSGRPDQSPNLQRPPKRGLPICYPWADGKR